MKITWLDLDCTEAVVTRGLFRPKSTVVTRDGDAPYTRDRWRFASTGRVVSSVDWHLACDLESRRDQEMRRRADESDWTDTGRFPKARLLERKS